MQAPTAEKRGCESGLKQNVLTCCRPFFLSRDDCRPLHRRLWRPVRAASGGQGLRPLRVRERGRWERVTNCGDGCLLSTTPPPPHSHHSRTKLVCVCYALPPTRVPTAARIVILQHPIETERRLGTVPLIGAAVAGVDVCVGRRFDVSSCVCVWWREGKRDRRSNIKTHTTLPLRATAVHPPSNPR